MSHPPYYPYCPPHQPRGLVPPPYEIVVFPAHTYPPQAQPYPSSGGGYPSVVGGYPSVVGGYPSVVGGYPSTGGGYPSTGGGYPSTRSGYPGPGVSYPTRRQDSHHGMTLSDVYGYDDGPSRNRFVRAVFLLLSLMLAITAVFVLFCMSYKPLTSYLLKNVWIKLIGVVLYFISSMALICCPITRSVPWNYLFLCMSVVGMSLIAGCMAVVFKTAAVLLAFVVTIILCLFLTALAYSSFDFTRYILYVVVFAIVFFMIGMAFMFLCIFYKYIKPLHMLLCGIGVILNAMNFVIELQMILGGRSVELEADEYVYGAWSLYISIMQMFLNLLRLTELFDDYI